MRWSAMLMVQGYQLWCGPVGAGNPFLLVCWTDCAPGKLCYTDEKKQVPVPAISFLGLFIRGPWADTQVVSYGLIKKSKPVINMDLLSYESTNRG